MWQSNAEISIPSPPSPEPLTEKKNHSHLQIKVPIPGTGTSVNIPSVINVIWQNIFGWKDDWIHDTMGIIESIIEDTIIDIKNSEDYDIDPFALIIANLFDKNDEEVKHIFEKYTTLNNIKNAINKVVLENADDLAKEFKREHFVGFDKKLLDKMNEELLKEIKIGILYSVIHDSEHPNETLEEHMARLEKSLTHDSDYYYSEELGKFVEDINKDPSRYESDKDKEDTLESIAKAKLGMIEELDGGKRKDK
jgi:hypothetical protein